MKLVENGSVIIADIEVGNRLRSIDQDWVEGLAETIKTSGLQNPIELVRIGNSLRLVSGAHRLAAFKHLNLASIPARIVEPETEHPELEIRMDEIVENIGRRELSALDRATHVAELKSIYVKLHGETRGAGSHAKNKNKSITANIAVFNLSPEVSTKMGLSERTIRADAALFDGLSAASRKAVVGTYLAENRAQLASLSKQPHDDQKALLKILLAAEPKASTMTQALALHFNKVDTQNPDEKAFASFVKLWGKASKHARKQIVLYIEKARAK
jgi:ParB family transcriptional regulator, chromosome partitioning protein